MKRQSQFYKYSKDGSCFSSRKVAKMRMIYAPLCGVDADGIKSAITPYLSGDIKIDKNRYLTRPVSREDLRRDTRNFFVHIEGKGVVSLTDEVSQDNACVEVGQLWHLLRKKYLEQGIVLEVVNCVPVSGEKVELMRIRCTNVSAKVLKITPTASVPIFGRALENKHDHEHVTTLLHRIEQWKNGVVVAPSMSFDERGHQPNDTIYYVLGVSDTGEDLGGTFPTVSSFYGEGTTAMVEGSYAPTQLDLTDLHGQEAFGGLRFASIELQPGEVKGYFVLMGIANDCEEVNDVFERFHTIKQFDAALEDNKKYWHEKSHAITFRTGDASFNAWLHWVTLQPVLRRIFGCSFLPDHDYGKGGKGWRDIWQDLLSLILIEPQNVRATLINNFAGVRIDGSNATIIGSRSGEFVADRNAIARVWMDHGVWPFMTLLLYINQTGDYDILQIIHTYFRDIQFSRTFEKDVNWTSEYGQCLKDKQGRFYKGSILEHILVQHLVMFFNVGKHNIMRLESADWNDGLDMAFEHGESVAFMSMYGGNFLALADLLQEVANTGINEVNLAKEVVSLLDTLGEIPVDYEDVGAKQQFLFKHYFPSVQPEISGEQIIVCIKEVIIDLRKKGEWIAQHIRANEKVVGDTQDKYEWFNGYYDNKEDRVEGLKNGRVWMTLTGQVFPIMSGVAQPADVSLIIEAVNEHLKDRELGGIRLNTDFGRCPYLDLGRAFGFAYGTKENGAFFSHMIVMYAYALYHRGFAKEGHKVLSSIYQMCMNTEKSKIYPGVPEYFDSQGRGMYHYLTGAASWWVLTQLTQVFGVRGEGGDLVLNPQLVKSEFDEKGIAQVESSFAGANLTVIYENQGKSDVGDYEIEKFFWDDKIVEFDKIARCKIKIKRDLFKNKDQRIQIRVLLK